MNPGSRFNSREPLQVVAVSTTMDCILLLYAAILRYGGEPNYRRIAAPEEFADVVRESTGAMVIGLWPDCEFAGLAASAVLRDTGTALQKVTLKNFGGVTMVAVVGRSSPALLSESERLTAALDRLLTEIREQANLSEAEALPIARVMTEEPPGYQPYVQSRELVAQDLSNLVTVILGCGEVLAEKLQDHAGRRYVDDLMHATRRVARLLVEFKGAGQAHSPVPLDAALVLGAARGMLQTMAGDWLSIAIRMSAASALVSMDRRRLENMAADIVAHARLAAPLGNSVHISVDQITLPDGGSTTMHLKIVAPKQ